MIPVKDLRYGNVVKFRNKFVPECYTIGVIMTISSPIITGYSLYNESEELKCNFWDLEPIKISTQMLLDNGFKQDIVWKDLYHNGDFYVWFYHEINSVMLHRCKPNNKNYYFLNDIHNLYYYLTLA